MNANETLIRQFITAWSRLDAKELASYFTEDDCYHNMPTQPVCGRENVEKLIAGFSSSWKSTEWEVLNLISSGNLVMAERVDRAQTSQGDVALPCVGVFEIEAGKIKVWRDYFDMATYANQLKG